MVVKKIKNGYLMLNDTYLVVFLKDKVVSMQLSVSLFAEYKNI